MKCIYWYQIFAVDSAVVEVQEMFSSHGSLLTSAIKLTHYNATKNKFFINMLMDVRIEANSVDPNQTAPL